jgi:hypothetical protein
MPGWNYVLVTCLNKACSGLTRALAVKRPTRKTDAEPGRCQELVATCLINMPAARGCTTLAPTKGACAWGKDNVCVNANPRAEMSRHCGLRAPALEENKCRIVSVCAAMVGTLRFLSSNG